MQRELEEFAAENTINVTAEAEVTPATTRVSLACHQLYTFDFAGGHEGAYDTSFTSPPPSFSLMHSQLQSLTRSSSSDSSDSEVEPPPQRPDAELTKAAPPSYHAASNFPTGDPLKSPPTDLPPPYPGPPTAQASAGDPPAGLGFSPVTSNYQGPPSTNQCMPYPPVTPSHELAYPPNTGEN